LGHPVVGVGRDSEREDEFVKRKEENKSWGKLKRKG
jgi:hypothetical protein